jgi:hypothetical protein
MHRETRDPLKLAMAACLCTAGLSLGNPATLKAAQSDRAICVRLCGRSSTRTCRSGRVRRVPALEALVRTTLARCFKGDPKAVASLIGIMRQSGYGPDRDKPSADLLSAVDYEAILADYRARNFSSDEADPEVGTSVESSTAAVSATKARSDDPN